MNRVLGRRGLLALGLLAVTIALAAGAALSKSADAGGKSSATAPTSCDLGNGISHVINIVFDNVHFSRDNPNVPSDLEQMPHLLNFLQAERHRLLELAHADDRAHGRRQPDDLHRPVRRPSRPAGVELLQDLQPRRVDRSGDLVHVLDVAGHRHQEPTRPRGTTTDAVDGLLGPRPGTIGDTSQITPAPWVPFTRAGCTVGDFSTANMVLENAAGDLPTVFGASSPEVDQFNAKS